MLVVEMHAHILKVLGPQCHKRKGGRGRKEDNRKRIKNAKTELTKIKFLKK